MGFRSRGPLIWLSRPGPRTGSGDRPEQGQAIVRPSVDAKRLKNRASLVGIKALGLRILRGFLSISGRSTATPTVRLLADDIKFWNR